jgi:hypothetical protein
MATLLPTLLGVALVSGGAFVLRALRCRRSRCLLRHSPRKEILDSSPSFPPLHVPVVHRPTTWLAVRSRHLCSVQCALGLHNPKPCTWTEGLSSEGKLFIAPPVNGWILAIGSGLPEPDEDVDACFRCLLDLSRKLGHVQFFSAVPALGYHMWARAEAGRVVRAYAWAGTTLWNQGIKTPAELELGLKCFQYHESPPPPFWGRPNVITTNTERVPLLAARWSLDPTAVQERVFEQACGVAGEPSPLY